ncbi:MAG: putative flippase AglD2 [Candidatus Methanohalarchaeum thermophilum]|uniref:Flippase AglD2 n=1 Tax=Methanohalarchaeum thermophilum TaxID=1903181 RepID=A0A1Q6DXG5_METT1|nr:MAG: putative flippase AglD2 [Candidatus Methanohalarchaeum thermophilum]
MKKTRKLVLISLIISAISIGIVIYFTSSKGILDKLRRIDPFFLSLAILAHVGQWVFWGLRVEIFARASELDLGLRKSLEIVLSSTFAACITPSYAGGEPIRIYLLGKEEDSSAGLASAIVFGERALDIVFLIIFGSFSMFALRSVVSSTAGLNLGFLFASFLLALAAVLLLIGLFRPSFIKWFMSLVEGPIEKVRPGVMKRIYKEIDSFNQSLWIFIKEGKIYLLVGFICTILLWGLEFSVPYLLITGLGGEIDFITAWSAYALILVLVMVPATPGGSGIAEVGASVIYPSIGQIVALPAFVIIWRFITYYLNIGVGGFVSAKVLKDLSRIEEEI